MSIRNKLIMSGLAGVAGYYLMDRKNKKEASKPAAEASEEL